MRNDDVRMTLPPSRPFPAQLADRIGLPVRPARLGNARPTGDLARRMEGAVARLTGLPYADNLPYHAGWVGPASCPGDVPGRWLNAMSLYAHALGFMPRDVYNCGRRLWRSMNSGGYIGPMYRPGDADENSFVANSIMMYGSLAWTEATGDAAGLELAQSIADNLLLPNAELLCSYGDAGRWAAMAPETGCTAFLVRPVAKLFRATGKAEYLELAEGISRTWQAWDLEGTKAQAHVNMQAMLGLIDLHIATGRDEFFRAAMDAMPTYMKYQTVYRGIANRLTPAILERGAQAESAGDAGAIHNLAVNLTYTETCGITDWIDLNLNLWALTLEPHYLDRAEMALWNGLMGSQEPAGSFACLAFEPLHPATHRGIEDVVWCCNMWGARGYALPLPYACVGLADGAVVNLYLPGVYILDADDGSIRLEIDTDYPNSGNVKVTVLECGEAARRLYFRVPGWSSVEGIAWGWHRGEMNSQGLTRLEDREGCVGLEGELKPGLTVRLSLAMPLRVECGEPGHIEEPVDLSDRTASIAFFAGPCELAVDAQYNPEAELDGIVEVSVGADGTPNVERADIPGDVAANHLRMPGLHFRVDAEQGSLHLSPMAEFTCADKLKAKMLFRLT